MDAKAKVVALPQRMNRMSNRPSPGQRVTVFMRDGTDMLCNSTRLVGMGYDGVFLYHKRKMLDESNAIGWWPVSKELK